MGSKAVYLVTSVFVVMVLAVVLFKTIDMGGFNLWYLNKPNVTVEEITPIDSSMHCGSEWC